MDSFSFPKLGSVLSSDVSEYMLRLLEYDGLMRPLYLVRKRVCVAAVNVVITIINSAILFICAQLIFSVRLLLFSMVLHNNACQTPVVSTGKLLKWVVFLK